MKKTVSIVAVILVAALVLAGCGAKRMEAFNDGFVPTFWVEGDVETVLRVDRNQANALTWTTVESDGETLAALRLADVIAAANPRAADFSLLMVGSDGLSSMIEGDALDDSYISFSAQFGWACVHTAHPISSKVKMLHKIIVITTPGVEDARAVGIVDTEGSRFITVGQLMQSGLTQIREYEGHSEIDGLGVTVFTPHERLALPDILQAEARVCAIAFSGEILFDNSWNQAYVEVTGNRIDYTSGTGATLEDIAGVMADAPNFTVASVYEDALHFLESGERVLVIELDGLGWKMLESAPEAMPYLSAFESSPALAAYPPISPVGLATMTTGMLPSVHGIHDRSSRDLLVEDIFSSAEANGKTTYFVEGESTLINNTLVAALSPDLDGVNSSDNEVFAAAAKAEAQQVDLLFVHVHGIDEAAHENGPYAAQTLEKMMYIDEQVRQLVEGWNGRVIVTADHGLHVTQEGGSHGMVCDEDMLVPYILTFGGKTS